MSRSDSPGELNPLLQEAASASWSVRAAAGRRLAAFAEVPEAAEALRRLLLDDRDTFVTQETAEALLARRDVLGLRMVLAAFADADDDTADHLDDALLGVRGGSEEDGRRLAALCSALASDPDGTVRREARGLLGPLR
ncbi:hypothetical protein AB0E83_12615 [Streptomyces sp. NPDC035033]|uniref:hypothetical protein n=1 Tax=Streptomyces sp. NPDC035033 TaxID=3155368 RepID=UPI0033E5A632